ncbi:hypothetical protein [Agromyces allii]|uniref:Galactose oxidase n=1 Tax=Agromyces allii TaxID=393607 RepID=A0ABN2QT91_9MICO|nr:hypothetical protein [Agromyces allii]
MGPAVVWTGTEVIVAGGDTGPPCPPNADCVSNQQARDGAALDPATGRWRRISDAPVDIPPYASAAYADGRALILASTGDERRLLSYDVDTDRWDRINLPDDAPRALVGDGDRVLLASTSDEHGRFADFILDVETGAWSQLTADPLGQIFDRVLTPTPDGLVLTGKQLVEDPGADGPALTIAAWLDRRSGKWSRLPDTEQIGGWRWAWTGTRLVDPTLGGGDGGEVGSWDRSYPYGGAISVPDGQWSPLPEPPSPRQDHWLTDTAGGRFSFSGGYVYDDRRSSWTPIDRPDHAPQHADAAVWADDRLVVVGGTDWNDAGGTISSQTWIFDPEPSR